MKNTNSTEMLNTLDTTYYIHCTTHYTLNTLHATRYLLHTTEAIVKNY